MSFMESTPAPIAVRELPTVSVLVLNYNGLQHLERCFSSLQQLEYPAEKLELILVDNHSSDGSVEFMRAQFPTVKTICHTENFGFSKGNNLGAAQARGQLVAFLNNDMRVDPRWLIELVQPLLRAPGVVSAGSKILSWDGQYIDYGGSAASFMGFGYQEGWQEPPTAHDEAKLILAPCGGAMLVDRQVFLDSGGFDEDYFAFYEDLDLGWRLWVMGYQAAYAPRAITYHVHHGWWGQVPNAKVSLLYQRNAFSTMFKNYSDENLRRVLPMALLLYLRRTYLVTELDASHLRSESPAIAPHLHAETPHADPLPVSPGSSTAEPVYDGAYYLQETWRTLRRDGPARLVRKAAAELQRRWRNRPRRLFSVKRRAPQQARPGYSVVNRRAISHLIAADDLVRDWEHLMQKRQAVQRRRRRTDQEIFKLFGQPFHTEYSNPHYVQTLNDLADAGELHSLFEQEGAQG